MDIRVDDLSSPQIVRLLGTHLRDMGLHSPPESVHALDLESLRRPDVPFADYADDPFSDFMTREILRDR